MRAAIVPLPQPRLPNDAASAVYEIVESDELPLVDMSRSVRSVLLPPHVARIWDRFLARCNKLITATFLIVMPLWSVVLVVPAPVGRSLSVGFALPMLLGGVTHFSLLRYDVIILLTKTYEFWFFTISNLVSFVLLVLYFGDTRALLAVSYAIGYQNNLLVDANISLQREFVPTSAIGALFTLVLMTLIALGLVDDVNDFELVRVDDNRIVRVQDVVSLGLSTQVVMLCRNAYRRRAALRQRSVNSASIDCVTIRARVKLQLIENMSRVGVFDSSRSSPNAGTSLVQMKLRPLNARFHADHVVLPCVGRLRSRGNSSVVRRGLASVASVGLILPFLSLAVSTSHQGDQLRWAALTITVVFVLGNSAMYQRQLLQQIVFSFDYVFISTQLTVIHWCLADLCNWDSRSLSILTYWLWLQWVLTCDAMTPVIRRKCGIRYRLPAFIMLIFIISQAVVFIVVAVVPEVSLRNRVIVSVTVRGRAVEMKVVPVLLSRLLVVFGWSCRIIWRLCTMKNGDLLMIQGKVKYFSNRKLEKNEEKRLSSVVVNQPPNPG